MLKIIDIEADSIAAELGIEKDSYIISVNGNEVNDRLDLKFYSSEEEIELLIRQGGENIIFEIEKEIDEEIGLLTAEMKMKACGNNCVFCFVHQNPKGMRRALYFQDEDYRFSFMYGHYVTLTIVKQKDLERIVEQRLSPLYISVHAVEEKIRKFLLGIKKDDFLLEKIEYLTSHGIELHAQIVLCPGINDGQVFEETAAALSRYYPSLRSIALVPLGLTQHREGLPYLRIHTKQELKDTIKHTDELRSYYQDKLGSRFIYIADEFFIKSGEDLPAAEYYDDFYQIENGVGEFRELIDSFNTEWPRIPEKLDKPVRISWVTGELAAGNLEKYIISKLRMIQNLQIDLVPVRNNFYGPHIQVSGLLTGADIYEQLKNRQIGDVVFLPPRVLNEDGLLLDDWTPAVLSERLGCPVHVYTEDVSEIAEVIKAQTVHMQPAGYGT